MKNDRVDWKDIRPHPDLARLLARCACGRDLGDHLVVAPHGTEDGRCKAFRAVRAVARL